MQRPLTGTDRLTTWLGAVVLHLKQVSAALDVRFDASVYDTPLYMRSSIRQALRSGRVPPAAQPFLSAYADTGHLPFSTAVSDFCTVCRTTEQSYDDLMRIYDIRQGKDQSLTAYLEQFMFLKAPVADYYLPVEVQGTLLLRGVYDDAVRTMASAS